TKNMFPSGLDLGSVRTIHHKTTPVELISENSLVKEPLTANENDSNAKMSLLKPHSNQTQVQLRRASQPAATFVFSSLIPQKNDLMTSLDEFGKKMEQERRQMLEEMEREREKLKQEM